MNVSKAERTRALRYKRPALQTMGFDTILSELEEISCSCDDVSYFIGDQDALLDAFDGDEEEAYEFRFAFADLSAKCEELFSAMYEWETREDFDDCTVALIGNRYDVVGFDTLEEDYYSLTRYEEELATTEAGKRLMRKTKAEIISSIGQALGTLLAFLDLRERYDYLKATMDILRDENHSILQTVKQIEEGYEKASEEYSRSPYSWSKAWEAFDRLTAMLPDRMWVE